MNNIINLNDKKEATTFYETSVTLTSTGNSFYNIGTFENTNSPIYGTNTTYFEVFITPETKTQTINWSPLFRKWEIPISYWLTPTNTWASFLPTEEFGLGFNWAHQIYLQYRFTNAGLIELRFLIPNGNQTTIEVNCKILDYSKKGALKFTPNYTTGIDSTIIKDFSGSNKTIYTDSSTSVNITRIHNDLFITKNTIVVGGVATIYSQTKPINRSYGILFVGDRWINTATGVEGFWDGTDWVTDIKRLTTISYGAGDILSPYIAFITPLRKIKLVSTEIQLNPLQAQTTSIYWQVCYQTWDFTGGYSQTAQLTQLNTNTKDLSSGNQRVIGIPNQTFNCLTTNIYFSLRTFGGATRVTENAELSIIYREIL